MNSTLNNSVDDSISHEPYRIYQLQIIRHYYPEAPISLEIGRDLKALGYSLQDWQESNAGILDQNILSEYWGKFLDKSRIGALQDLNSYIKWFFPEAEDRMSKAMEAEDREAGLLLDEV